MSATGYGRGPVYHRKIEEQTGGELVVNRDSSSECTEIFRGRYVDLVNQSPAKDSPHPLWPDLLLVTKRFSRGKLGLGTATLLYRGIDPSRSAGSSSGASTGQTVLGTDWQDLDAEEALPEVDLEYDTAVSQEPIATHPDIGDLIEAAGSEGVKYDEEGYFIKFTQKASGDLAGVQSYRVPRTVTTRTYWTDGAAAVAKVGIRVGSDLRLSLKSSRYGSKWRNVEVLESGPWNTLIYKDH